MIMPKRKCNDDSICRVCGSSDDSNNAEGPCSECQENRAAFEIDHIMNMFKDGEFHPKITRALMQRKKFSDV